METIFLAIKGCQNVNQVDNLFSKMSSEDQVNLPVLLVSLQESHDHDIREFGMIQSLKLTEKQIYNNFVPLLNSKYSKFQAARDLASQILNRLSQEDLVKQFSSLIYSLKSKFYFVSSEADRLISSIEIKLLFDEYNNLKRLQNSDDQDVRRVVSKLLVKMILAWPIETKIGRQKQIAKWSRLEEFKNVCTLTSLQVAQFWSDAKIVNNLNHFIEHSKSEDFVISELAAKLAFKALLLSPISVKQENIKYLASFHYFGNTDLSTKFRQMALSVIVDFPAKELSNFFDFLMQCQEAKDPEVCEISWNLLLMINSNDLVIENLVNWQASGSKGPKRAARILASKISQDRLGEKLEYFIDCQKSSDADMRNFASELALKVDKEYLQNNRDFLLPNLNSKFINIAYLAENLLDKADKPFFGERVVHWLYWRV